jgi:hypothetical protein
MTIHEATEILYEAASRQGIAMNRDEAEFMARKILMITLMDQDSMIGRLKPGDIAQYHRNRYEEDQTIFDMYDSECIPGN